MKKILLLILLFPIVAAAQLKMAGKVVDAKTKQPIAYVNIENFKAQIGTQTNLDGLFELNLLKGKQTDTIKISCVGYLDKLVTNLNANTTALYELTPAVFQLNEIKVLKRKIAEKVVGVINTKGHKILASNQRIQRPGLQRAVLMKNDGYEGYLKSIHFYIGSDMYEAPFRVHIYENEDNSPGQDLLNKSLEFAAYKNNSWNEFDISTYNLSIPKDGFWVSLEWIMNEKYMAETKPFSATNKDGQLITGLTVKYYGPEILEKFGSIYGITYQKLLGGKWEKLKAGVSYDKGKNYKDVKVDLLIKATLQIYKD